MGGDGSPEVPDELRGGIAGQVSSSGLPTLPVGGGPDGPCW